MQCRAVGGCETILGFLNRRTTFKYFVRFLPGSSKVLDKFVIFHCQKWPTMAIKEPNNYQKKNLSKVRPTTRYLMNI